MEKEFIEKKGGLDRYEVVERLSTGLVKVKLRNGNYGVVNQDGEIQYIINRSAEEVAEEERAKMAEVIREVIREELQSFKAELLGELS